MSHEISMAATRTESETEHEQFLATSCAKHPKATELLTKDRERLFTLYHLPAEHWRRLRTTNPIESTFPR